ncbi:FscB [Roseovarius autotrophicus]|uniref:FscB n=1 Tax=Roseovarius autotrophicus TaxID=2824121 RepID=UPI001B373C95|nr:FscB [Roseovarius autotrophicus]
MSYILHLGHQPTDISGVAGLLSTVAAGFDDTLDVNGLRFSGARTLATPFAVGFPAPAGDLWLGFRYVPPNLDSESITQANAGFLEFFDAENIRIAQIRPLTSTNRYHAEAHGDTLVQGSSSYFAPNGQAQWVDVRLSVDADITVEFFVDGVLQSAATVANTGGKGKPVQVVFANTGLHGTGSSRTWYYAHIAVLDGVSTIGRRFVRRIPNAIATFNEMVGSIDALNDSDIATRVASTTAGQRMSFSLTGPTGPATVSAIAGVHLKQIAQAGTDGPDATAGFLRMAGVNHDAAPLTVPSLAPVPVYSSWAVNPADASPWSDLTLPNEVGILSA